MPALRSVGHGRIVERAAQIASHLGHADGGVLAQRTDIHPAAVDVSFLDDVLGG
jgi:hypothetical protein